MKTIRTHCALRLGDNLAHVHFLRKLAEANPGHVFEHHLHAEYIRELEPMTIDRPIKLVALQELHDGRRWYARPALPSIDAWKNAGGRFDRADPSARNDYAGFMLGLFRELAGKMGLVSPMTTPRDMLFDYAALENDEVHYGAKPLDFLVMNAQPMSGQAPGFRNDEMDRLIVDLREHRYTVIATNRTPSGAHWPCTQDWGWSVTKIGKLSQRCRRILMVSTGPSWTTFNIWNRKTIDLRIIIHPTENIGLDPDAIHTADVDGVRSVLKAKGLL